MDEYDPVKEFEDGRAIRALINDSEISEIDEVLNRLHEMNLSEEDYSRLFDALNRAKMYYFLEEYFQEQSAKYEAAEIILRGPESPQKKRTKVLQIFKLDRIGKKNLEKLAQDYQTLVNGSRLFPELRHATGLRCTQELRDIIAKGGENRKIKPKILNNKRDVIKHLAILHGYQSVDACYKALQRQGVKGLPSTWENFGPTGHTVR